MLKSVLFGIVASGASLVLLAGCQNGSENTTQDNPPKTDTPPMRVVNPPGPRNVTGGNVGAGGEDMSNYQRGRDAAPTPTPATPRQPGPVDQPGAVPEQGTGAPAEGR
jgi:hypothetical protein